ncbi:MAG: N-acetylglucosamine kinase NagK [Rhodobacteraceae bacterium HLUCCA08]|nr:MAG: N-acetylglucosamine kinase NagK [Rhodobacteraceae bacterium HLUCCA08]
MLCGGIDIGGTKIEARLFDATGADLHKTRRVPTPRDAFAPMAEALADQVRWLEATGGGRFPIGLSVAGIIDPTTGESFAANIPATGRSIPDGVEALTGRRLPIVNDCMAFAYSEAHGGAGDGARSVMGLILGTGVGGGLCIDGHLPHRHAGLAVEIGHLGAPARALERHGLPLRACGCGRLGCMEVYISGTGLANLSEWTLGRRLSGEQLSDSTDPEAAATLDIWADIAGECLDTIQIMLDPDCIVIGGGVSNLPGIAAMLTDSLARHRLGKARLPRITTPRHGDSSGARGAALIARDAWPET